MIKIESMNEVGKTFFFIFSIDWWKLGKTFLVLKNIML